MVCVFTFKVVKCPGFQGIPVADAPLLFDLFNQRQPLAFSVITAKLHGVY